MTQGEFQRHSPLVLVVDDDLNTRLLTRAALEQAGFSVTEAKDGEEALAVYQARHPELILLDVVMPGMDGFDTCAELRRRKDGDGVPIVMMTALDDIESIRKAYEAGATDFITKPINWLILGQRMRYMLRSARTADELRRSEARNQAIFDAIPDLMFCITRDGVILDVKGTQILPLFVRLERSPGRRMSEVLLPEIAELVTREIDRALERGGMQFCETQLETTDGPASLEVRIVPSAADEALVMVRDITLRKAMEQEVLKAQKLEALGILAGGIAHDFNNLLSIILTNISLARMDLEPGTPCLVDLSTAEQAIVRAKDLTKKFITFSGGGAPHKKLYSAGELVMESVEAVGLDSVVKCRCTIAEDLWAVEIDRGQMRQAVQNVLINAVEAMPAGGLIRIDVRNMESGSTGSRVVPSLKGRPYVKISIKDEGVGISSGDLSRVFDPYFSSKQMDSHKGLGLGLTVAHSVLSQHGGHITVESGHGAGTVVHLYIPAHVPGPA